MYNSAKYKIYYQKNKEKLNEKSMNYARKNRTKVNLQLKQCKDRYKKIGREYVQNYKLHKTCCKCNTTQHLCLDFHHIDPNTKRQTISKMVLFGYNIKRIQEEINKCILLCRNCHAKEHTRFTARLNKKEQLILKIKRQNKCLCCSETDHVCLEFHHLRNKIASISQIGHYSKYTMQDVISEIEKCVILCKNCHQLVHFGIIQLPSDIKTLQVPTQTG